jgi:aspartate-semialdehyde dehydrogenase
MTRFAVVGATGLVGRTMLQVLIERGLAEDVRALASGRSVGSEVNVGGVSWTVAEATAEAFEGVEIALFSAGADVSRELAPKAVNKGAVVIDNSAAWRMEADVPLVVSQVNPDDLAWHHGIIANPNCSTMQLAPLLAALRDTVGLERVIVDTYQAVSGTGADATEEFEAQIQAHVAGTDSQPHVYPHRIAFNALPEIDVFLDDGYTKEEWKVIVENRKILHLPELRVSCTAVRVPVFVSHSEAVHVETTRAMTPAVARELFAGVSGVVVVDDPAAHAYPLATDATGRDEIFVGRIRADASLPDGRGLAFWVVSDNLRKGAATNAVEIAQLLIADTGRRGASAALNAS